MTGPITFSNVTLGYNHHPAVHHLSMTLQPGSMTALVGPNGGGKSTLLKAIVGEIKPRTGTIDAPPRKAIAYLPQLSEIDRTFPISVLEVVAMGLWARAGAFGRLGAADRDETRAALAAVGLSGFERRAIGALSGGQMQRVLLARALINDPEILLLDEATQGLDQPGSAAFYRQIEEVRKDTGCAVLMISHELHVVMSASDRVICLNGHVCCEGSPEIVSAAPEYRALFGSGTGGALALYRHDHDHAHDETCHQDHAHSHHTKAEAAE